MYIIFYVYLLNVQHYWRREPLDVAVVLFNELTRDFFSSYICCGWLFVCLRVNLAEQQYEYHINYKCWPFVSGYEDS